MTLIPRTSSNVLTVAVATVLSIYASLRVSTLWKRYQVTEKARLQPAHLATIRIAIFRQLPSLTLVFVFGTIFAWCGLYAPSPSHGANWLTGVADSFAVLAAVSSLLSLVVLLSNRPRRLVPPLLRNRPGALGEYRSMREGRW